MSEPENISADLSQPQREAVLDLLLMGMYADDWLKLSEDERITKAIGEIGWHDLQTPHEYMNLAIARVRAAHESHVGLEPFLREVSSRLGSSSARTRALDLLESMLETDSMVVDSEHDLHERARAVFGL